MCSDYIKIVLGLYVSQFDGTVCVRSLFLTNSESWLHTFISPPATICSVAATAVLCGSLVQFCVILTHVWHFYGGDDKVWLLSTVSAKTDTANNVCHFVTGHNVQVDTAAGFDPRTSEEKQRAISHSG